LPSRRARARTTNACSVDTLLNASCIAWGGRHTGTNLLSKEPPSSRFGRARLIVQVEETIRAICEIQEEDGIVFDHKSVEGTKINEEDEYDGVRIKFQAELAGARIPMQIDIGFGDAVYPEPELASFPVLLPMEAPVIRAYPREASIAEKFHAMVVLDIRNSRMKDFYDIWFMANTWTFDMASLSKAILASFQRRGTVIPKEVPLALTEEFLNDSQKKQQWAAFVSRLNPGDNAPSLEEVGAILQSFLLPCISGSTLTQADIRSWTPDRHWNGTESDTSSKPQQ